MLASDAEEEPLVAEDDLSEECYDYAPRRRLFARGYDRLWVDGEFLFLRYRRAAQ
jgi:hypothetical protein